MSLQIVIQVLINGLAIGSVYALISSGYSVIFNILKFSNFSHGATLTLSALIGYYFCKYVGNSVPLVFVCLISMAAGSIIAVCGNFIAFRGITKKNAPQIYLFIASITLCTFIESISTLLVGANFYTYPSFFANPTFTIGPFTISTSNIVMLICSVIALLVLTFIIQKTKLGVALRAVSFDRDTASLMGINVNNTINFAFVLSGAIAGLAGVFLGINYTITTALGSMVVKGFISSVIGGLGSLAGSVIGAMILGFMETIFTYSFGTGFKEVIVFAVMIIFLYIRPQGILGKNVQEKA